MKKYLLNTQPSENNNLFKIKYLPQFGITECFRISVKQRVVIFAWPIPVLSQIAFYVNIQMF